MKKTLENLTKAFIGESQARNRYTLYSKIAKNEGYVQISDIFLTTADNEREHAKWLFRMIQDLKKDFGFTIIFISHDLGVVHYLSDRVIIMNKGRIEESGTSDDIWLRPQKEYTKKLVSSIPKGYLSTQNEQ